MLQVSSPTQLRSGYYVLGAVVKHVRCSSMQAAKRGHKDVWRPMMGASAPNEVHFLRQRRLKAEDSVKISSRAHLPPCQSFGIPAWLAGSLRELFLFTATSAQFNLHELHS